MLTPIHNLIPASCWRSQKWIFYRLLSPRHVDRSALVRLASRWMSIVDARASFDAMVLVQLRGMSKFLEAGKGYVHSDFMIVTARCKHPSIFRIPWDWSHTIGFDIAIMSVATKGFYQSRILFVPYVNFPVCDLISSFKNSQNSTYLHYHWSQNFLLHHRNSCEWWITLASDP